MKKSLAQSARRYILIRRCTSMNKRALAFLLQHGLRFLRLQAEVVGLFRIVGAMRMRAPQRPATQSSERQLAEKLIQVFQHRSHAARRLCQKVCEKLQVSTEQCLVAETAWLPWAQC